MGLSDLAENESSKACSEGQQKVVKFAQREYINQHGGQTNSKGRLPVAENKKRSEGGGGETGENAFDALSGKKTRAQTSQEFTNKGRNTVTEGEGVNSCRCRAGGKKKQDQKGAEAQGYRAGNKTPLFPPSGNRRGN